MKYEHYLILFLVENSKKILIPGVGAMYNLCYEAFSTFVRILAVFLNKVK